MDDPRFEQWWADDGCPYFTTDGMQLFVYEICKSCWKSALSTSRPAVREFRKGHTRTEREATLKFIRALNEWKDSGAALEPYHVQDLFRSYFAEYLPR